ncbi:hypothetical protein EH223_14975 [candidate division KSB1 bacterium]|nr:hypothetical protein [candidate division KSB1 bacterium]RQW01467.1 MAG: hypothetical protein EH223_14975 [candidate division KSB1 bacterium]
MKKVTRRILFWMPRVLTILFAIFLSLFALDVFEEGVGLREALAGFFIHLIPTYIVILFLVLAWRWEWIGALAYLALGVFYIMMTKAKFPLVTYLLISGPLFLICLLFLLDWLYRKKIRVH